MATDKRVIKTKAGIKDAFMRLMTENELSKITVSDIAAKALVNRSTFYLHYGEVDDVMKEIEAEMANRIEVCIDSFDISDIYGSICAMLTTFTAVLDEKPAYKNYIVLSKDSSGILSRVKEILVEKTLEAICQAFPHVKRQNIIYPLTFAAAGLVESYDKWVRDPDKSKPLEELIREVSGITEHIIESITKQ